MLTHLLHLASRHLQFYWSHSRRISEFKLGVLISHSKVWVEWDSEEKPHSMFSLNVNLGWVAARGYVTL